MMEEQQVASDDVVESASAFRDVPRTGVIYVMNEAARAGYRPANPTWTNFGQGQPEVGHIDGAPPRQTLIDVAEDDHEYAPVVGLADLRAAVADVHDPEELVAAGAAHLLAELMGDPSGGGARSEAARLNHEDGALHDV